MKSTISSVVLSMTPSWGDRVPLKYARCAPSSIAGRRSLMIFGSVVPRASSSTARICSRAIGPATSSAEPSRAPPSVMTGVPPSAARPASDAIPASLRPIPLPASRAGPASSSSVLAASPVISWPSPETHEMALATIQSSAGPTRVRLECIGIGSLCPPSMMGV